MVSRKLQVCAHLGAKRIKYFGGKLLTAEDLQTEQNYHVNKHRELTRAILGVGIVTGLAVSRSGSQVTVTPGTAVDSSGRLLELPAPCQFDLPSTTTAWDVYLGAADTPVDPIPDAEPGGTMSSGPRHGAIQEVTIVWIETALSSARVPVTAEAVWLARVGAGRARIASASRRNGTRQPGRTTKATIARKRRRRR